MKLFLSLIVLFAVFHSFGQIDSTQITTYDLIYMKNGDTLKGQIISHDLADGDITFEDEKGKRFIISPVDYKSYKEDIPYGKGELIKVSNKKKKKIDRKVKE